MNPYLPPPNDPFAIRNDLAFGALILSDDPIDTEFVNMIPSILRAEGIEPVR